VPNPGIVGGHIRILDRKTGDAKWDSGRIERRLRRWDEQRAELRHERQFVRRWALHPATRSLGTLGGTDRVVCASAVIVFDYVTEN